MNNNPLHKIGTWLFSLMLLIPCSGLAVPSGIGLQLSRISTGTIPTGSNVVLDTIIFSSGNISYNSVTGVITFNQPGRYVVNWTVAYQGVTDASSGAVLAIATSQGDFLQGNSPAPNGQVVGSGILEVTTTPVTMSLVNSAGKLVLGSQVPVKATLTIVESVYVVG
jgi:hypothetical protein